MSLSCPGRETNSTDKAKDSKAKKKTTTKEKRKIPNKLNGFDITTGQCEGANFHGGADRD